MRIMRIHVCHQIVSLPADCWKWQRGSTSRSVCKPCAGLPTAMSQKSGQRDIKPVELLEIKKKFFLSFSVLHSHIYTQMYTGSFLVLLCMPKYPFGKNNLGNAILMPEKRRHIAESTFFLFSWLGVGGMGVVQNGNCSSPRLPPAGPFGKCYEQLQRCKHVSSPGKS